jgi:phage shock protein E
MKIIDVRTKEEYDRGHLDGAMLFDIQDMIQGVYPDLDKNEAITLYCQSGNRSKIAKVLLEKEGFINITDGGGMNELAEKLRSK